MANYMNESSYNFVQYLVFISTAISTNDCVIFQLSRCIVYKLFLNSDTISFFNPLL